MNMIYNSIMLTIFSKYNIINKQLVLLYMVNNENKSTRFKRLATNRVNNAINTLRLIGNLSNTNNYSFEDNDVSTIFNAIDDELKLTKARFSLTLKRRRKIKL
jgi:hypothetical protein